MKCTFNDGIHSKFISINTFPSELSLRCHLFHGCHKNIINCRWFLLPLHALALTTGGWKWGTALRGHPQVCWPCVKHHIEHLRRRSNADFAKILSLVRKKHKQKQNKKNPTYFKTFGTKQCSWHAEYIVIWIKAHVQGFVFSVKDVFEPFYCGHIEKTLHVDFCCD